jgi:hypothetical protein
MSLAVFVPANAVVWMAAAGSAASLPAGGLPEGDSLLILVECLRPVLAPLGVAMITGWAALWAWTVLWHAGVVRWSLFAGRVDVRLAEILGHGLVGWWRWARLGLTSMAVLVIAHLAVWLPLGLMMDDARRVGDEVAAFAWLGAAVAMSLTVLALCWSATLRAAWVLGIGDRRSAAASWLVGLGGSLRQPLRSTATLAVWAIPGFAAILLPLVVGWRFEALRGGPPGALVEVTAGLLGAFCWVGLFMSFAPVTGLVGGDAGERNPE